MAQCGGQPCEGCCDDQIQCAQPRESILPPEGSGADADPGEYAQRQQSQHRLHGRQRRIAAAQQTGKQQAGPLDIRAAQPGRGEQGYVVHQRVCAEQHIQINDHAAPPPGVYHITAGAQYLPNQGRHWRKNEKGADPIGTAPFLFQTIT